MRVLLSMLCVFFAAEAWADCTSMPSCAELNYTDTSCKGEFVTCPFDQTKKKCLPVLPSCEELQYTETSCQGDFLTCPLDPSKKRCLPLPTPAELCAAYPLTTCPSGGVCESCPDDSTRVRLASCDSSSSGKLCSDYPLSRCPTYGVCEYCSDDRSRVKLTGCQGDYYRYGNGCYATACQYTNFPNRRDLVIKAIEESSILDDYAKAWRSGGWLAYKDTFTESQIQMYVEEFVRSIEDSMNSTFCYNNAENMYVYASDYYDSKYSDERTQGGTTVKCCAARDSGGRSTICTDIRDYVEKQCQGRGQHIMPYGVSGDVCLGYGQASWSGVEVPNYVGDIYHYYDVCEQAMKKAGLKLQ